MLGNSPPIHWRVGEAVKNFQPCKGGTPFGLVINRKLMPYPYRPCGTYPDVGDLSFPGNKLPRYYQMSLAGHLMNGPDNFNRPIFDFAILIGFNTINIINKKKPVSIYRTGNLVILPNVHHIGMFGNSPPIHWRVRWIRENIKPQRGGTSRDDLLIGAKCTDWSCTVPSGLNMVIGHFFPAINCRAITRCPWRDI